MTREQMKQTNEPYFSMRNGIFLPFVYKGHQVVVHNSSWTFRETIWVDDDIVFTGMGYTFKSVREITVAGDRLELTFGMRSWGSEYFLEVRHEGELIVERTNNPYGKESKYGMWWVFGFGVLGGMFGYLAAKYALGLFS